MIAGSRFDSPCRYFLGGANSGDGGGANQLCELLPAEGFHVWRVIEGQDGLELPYIEVFGSEETPAPGFLHRVCAGSPANETE